MNMNMKLSYRDKVIFIVAIVLIILVAGFFVLIKPKFAEINTAKYNLETKQQERDDLNAKIDTLPTIIEDLKAAAEEIGDKQELFFDEQDPYLNETYVREALDVDMKSMNTSYTAALDLVRYTVTPQHILAYDNKMSADLYNELPQEVYDVYNEVPAPSYPSVVIGTTNMSFTFKSDNPMRDANTVLDKIFDDEKAIILNTISTTTEESAPANGEDDTGNEVTCNITMYSVFPLNIEQVLQETAEIKPLETPAAE